MAVLVPTILTENVHMLDCKAGAFGRGSSLPALGLTGALGEPYLGLRWTVLRSACGAGSGFLPQTHSLIRVKHLTPVALREYEHDCIHKATGTHHFLWRDRSRNLS
jgi:hypothetical protein